MNEQEFEELKRKVSELETWKADRERQQIAYPLDNESIKVLNKNFLSMNDEYTYFGGAAAQPFLVYSGSQDGKRFEVPAGNIRYTAATSDVISIVEKTANNRFANDQTISLFTTGTAPAGLTAEGMQTYYVIDAASDGFSFKVSLTEGGAAVNITDTGTGRQYLFRI
jgi:hypothetical protein